MRDFKQLKVWQKAHRLTLDVYRCTKTFPTAELYGLTSQMRRAAASIGANLAEGCGRRSDAEMNRFILIAMGSASELDYHLLLARDLGLLRQSEFELIAPQVSEVRRMLTALAVTVKAANHAQLRAKS